MMQQPLVDHVVRPADVARFRAQARRLPRLQIDEGTAMDLYHLATGAYTPLEGFLGEADYRSVVQKQCLADGSPWTIPIILAVSRVRRARLIPGREVALCESTGRLLGTIRVTETYAHPKRWCAKHVFGTTSRSHPGVARLSTRGDLLIGGPIRVAARPQALKAGVYLTPRQTRRIFRDRGWRTIAAFHTRNLPHRAHEYLERCALELVDGLLIHPIVGPKKPGDFRTEAVLAGYRYFLKRFLPGPRVVLAAFARGMEYAGPREAVFHAMVRRNFGCTHMIIGRDHAGVDGRYALYAAHAIFDTVGDVGIQPLRMKGPFYCRTCGGVATENTCAHGRASRIEISGTDVRRYIAAGQMPPQEILRPELATFLLRYRRRHPLFHGEHRAASPRR